MMSLSHGRFAYAQHGRAALFLGADNSRRRGLVEVWLGRRWWLLTWGR